MRKFIIARCLSPGPRNSGRWYRQRRRRQRQRLPSARATCRPPSAGTTPRSTRAPARSSSPLAPRRSSPTTRCPATAATRSGTGSSPARYGHGRGDCGLQRRERQADHRLQPDWPDQRLHRHRRRNAPRGEARGLPHVHELGQGDLFGKTQITGGLKVNGIDLPNTPVESFRPVASRYSTTTNPHDSSAPRLTQRGR